MYYSAILQSRADGPASGEQNAGVRGLTGERASEAWRALYDGAAMIEKQGAQAGEFFATPRAAAAAVHATGPKTSKSWTNFAPRPSLQASSVGCTNADFAASASSG